RHSPVLPLLPGGAGGGRVLPAQVHAVRPPGQLVAALDRLPRRAHAADPGGRDRAGALVAVAALPAAPEPRLRGRALLDARDSGRGLDSQLRRRAERVALAV